MTAGNAPGRVFFVTRKPLVRNSRVFNQVASLRRAGYDVLILGVARGDLPSRDDHRGTPIMRVTHDPMPRRLSVWLRRGGGSPAHAQNDGFAGASPRRRVLRLIRRLGTLPWLAQSLAFYIRAVRLLAAVSPAPTVVHATDLNALPAAAILARLRRVPLVYDAQELFTDMHTLPVLYRRLLQLQERVLLRAVDRLLVVNPIIGDVMADRYGRRPDAVVLNCPPFEVLPDGSPGPPDCPPRLVYSGGLLPQRGVEKVVLALTELPEARLLILGGGPLEPAVRRLAHEHGVGDRLTIRDFVEPGEMTTTLATADVGVLPYQDVCLNHRLCSPSKLFHYVMAGLPVVGSDLPFVRRVIVGHGIGEVFDPRSSTQLAAAVKRVMADPTTYRTRIMEVRRRFSWEHEEKAFLGVYRSLAAGKPPAAAQATTGAR